MCVEKIGIRGRRSFEMLVCMIAHKRRPVCCRTREANIKGSLAVL